MFGIESFSTQEVLENLELAFSFVYNSAFIWLPVLTSIAAFNMWLGYKRNLFWQEQPSILLEIKIPRVVSKSPAAMELALNAFYHTVGESTFIDRIFRGKTRHWFSLEIVSIEGRIHFYIWTRAAQKNLIESSLYSQYPGIEIHEVEDYTLPYVYDPAKNKIWCCEWKLTKADALPIKTYIDYGLDKDPKEEYKVDPMTTLIEFLGTLTAGNSIWVQIVIRAHRKGRFGGVFGEKEDKWKDEADEEIKKIIEKFRPKDKEQQSRQPTESEKNAIAAIGRSVGKLPFDVGVRTIYIADADKYNPSNIGGVTGAFRQYSYDSLNGLAPTGGVTGFDDFWKDPTGRVRERRKRELLEGYKRRQVFFPPYKARGLFVLNSEELATIFHFPGEVATTPTFERIPSKKSEAPFNLPT